MSPYLLLNYSLIEINQKKLKLNYLRHFKRIRQKYEVIYVYVISQSPMIYIKFIFFEEVHWNLFMIIKVIR